MALLASDALDRLYRCLTGSVVVSAYELAAMPLPVTGTGATCSGIAAAAAFTFMYVGAVDQQRAVQPAMVVGMSETLPARSRSGWSRLSLQTLLSWLDLPTSEFDDL